MHIFLSYLQLFINAATNAANELVSSAQRYYIFGSGLWEEIKSSYLFTSYGLLIFA